MGETTFRVSAGPRKFAGGDPTKACTRSDPRLKIPSPFSNLANAALSYCYDRPTDPACMLAIREQGQLKCRHFNIPRGQHLETAGHALVIATGNLEVQDERGLATPCYLPNLVLPACRKHSAPMCACEKGIRTQEKRTEACLRPRSLAIAAGQDVLDPLGLVVPSSLPPKCGYPPSFRWRRSS